MGNSSSLLTPSHDVVLVGHQYMNQEAFVKKTGWDGVKAILSLDQDGNITPQMSLISESTTTCGLLGGLLGGTLEAKQAYERFLRTNQATAFESPHMARRLMYDRTTLGFGRGFVRFGWRCTAFTGSFVFLTQAIPAYRGKHSFFDWTASAMLAGMAYKFKAGPKPMVAGMALGGLLGTMFSVVVNGLLALTGSSMDDIYDHKRTQSLRAMQKRHERLRKLRHEENELELAQAIVEKP